MLGSLVAGVLFLGAQVPHTMASPIYTLERRTSGSLLAVVPAANTCDGAPAPAECRTADEAAPFINQSFRTYGITTPGEAAAVIGIMAFESGDFKYNVNHFSGVPGQGTRNMQSPEFNLKYAQSLSGLQDELASAGSDPKGILALLTANGEYDFGSGAWFLTSQCSDSVRAGLKTGSLSGWQSYISDCIHTTPTPDRQAYWERAAKAMGVAR